MNSDFLGRQGKIFRDFGRIAFYLSEINVLHLFREGNERTQRLFIEYLAKNAGYEVAFSDVSAEEMIAASAEAYALEFEKLFQLFDRITTKN